MSTPGQHTPHKVVVIGGGYAGTLAANHLRMRADVDITLVNPRPEFVDRIRLHQFVAGTGEATVDYGTLLGEGIRLMVGSVARIDTAARTVRLASGRALDYDYVIYAVGSTAAIPSSVPGAAQFAVSVAETGGDRPGPHGVVRQPRQARRPATARPQRRHRGERLRRRPHGRGVQGVGLQTRGVEDPPRGPQAGLPALAQGRSAS